jgi:hypothetical protein
VLFQQKIGIANYLVYKIIGMELHLELQFFFGSSKIIVMEFSAIQGHDETAPFKLFVLCFIELFGW